VSLKFKLKYLEQNVREPVCEMFVKKAAKLVGINYLFRIETIESKPGSGFIPSGLTRSRRSSQLAFDCEG